MNVMKMFIECQVPKLVPYFIFVGLYFFIAVDDLLWSTLLKCFPIICLMFYIVLSGIDTTEKYFYSRFILYGLFFSCGGDILLNVDCFAHGMALFALAQICYISAFGFQPLKWFIAVPLYLAGAVLVAIIFKDLEGVLVVGLPVYVVLLLTMCWRSLARASDDSSNVFDIVCAVGSVLFVVSDALIGVDMFLINVPNARIWIMSTYYLAQLAIAISTTNEWVKNLQKASKLKSKD